MSEETKSITVKEMKDDAILDIKVNKNFYMMCKAAMFIIFKEAQDADEKQSADLVKAIMEKKYENLNDKQRILYTLTLLVAEIEKQAVENNLFNEKIVTAEDIKASSEK